MEDIEGFEEEKSETAGPTSSSVAGVGSYQNFKGLVVKPEGLKSKKDFETFEKLGVKEKKSFERKLGTNFEKEKIYYWLQSLKPTEIQSMVKKAQNKAMWKPKRLKEHIDKDKNHTFYESNKKLDYLEVEQKTKNEFDNIYFKLYKEKRKQMIFSYNKYNSVVIVDVTKPNGYVVKTLFENKRGNNYFMDKIRVDSKKNLKSKHSDIFPDLTLRDDIREEITFLKDLKEDTDPDEVRILLDSLQQANGAYPEYDIEFLDTFDIEVLRYYTEHNGSINKETLKKYSWHFFVDEITEGGYPLELLPEHVRGILKERYYKGKELK